MSYKLHVTGSVKSVKVVSRGRTDKEGKKAYKIPIRMREGGFVVLYLDKFSLKKLKDAMNNWWMEDSNERKG